MNRIVKQSTEPEVILYGPDDRPLPPSNGNGLAVAPTRRRVKALSSMNQFNDVNSWVASLASTRLPPSYRARDPFHNHPWVFAAAMTIATVASQAPYTIFRETEEQEKERKRFAQKHHGLYTPRRGSKRRAVQRHINKLNRSIRKGLEPDYDHEIADAILRANPYQNAAQLWQMTHLWMAVRGEVFWVLEGEEGQSLGVGEIPTRIWPLSPDLFEPILEHGQWGELVGWYFCPPSWMNKRAEGWKIALPLTDIVHFKYPNPGNPLRGMSRIGAVAMGIETDMLAKEFNKSIIENGGDPGGLLTYDADLEVEEEKEYIEKWEQTHKGPENARRTAILSGGFKYVPVALSPKDMQFLEQQDWDREEILAVMGVPRSVLGVPDQNYATQLGQDKNFWDKNLIPLLRLEETTLDGTLLFDQPDNVVGMFDLTDVEALRAGVAEKVSIAIELSGDALHMPPNQAFELVGLEVDEYEGDDVALVKFGIGPVGDAIEPAEEEEPEDTEEPPAPETESYEIIRHRLARVTRARHDDFIKLEEPLEGLMRGRYRGWVKFERKAHLEAFDEWAEAGDLKSWYRLKADSGSLIARLPPYGDTQKRLGLKVRPLYTTITDETYGFTVSELGGIPVFEVDDPVFIDVMQSRQTKLVNSVPKTLRKNIEKTVIQGFDGAETVQSLRQRIAQVFDISAGSAKSLQVARTETGSLMNAVRDAMFAGQGVVNEKWSTSKDERVRKTHVTYGEEKAQPRGFNYLEVTGKTGFGTLSYPGDTRCTDMSELLNCRCIKIPIL